MKSSLRRQKISFTYSRLRGVYCVAAFLALFGGIAIYAFFRDLNILLFQVFTQPSFLEVLHTPARTGSVLMSMLMFNLPHGLWCLSGLLIIRAIWLTNIKWRTIYGGIFIVAASLFELAQLNENDPGTFDVFDLTAYGVFAFAESLIFNILIKRRFL